MWCDYTYVCCDNLFIKKPFKVLFISSEKSISLYRVIIVIKNKTLREWFLHVQKKKTSSVQSHIVNAFISNVVEKNPLVTNDDDDIYYHHTES